MNHEALVKAIFTMGETMNYEEMKKEATSSDHNLRIISELEQPLKDAFVITPPSASVLEIGNREGGSAAVQLYYIALEAKGRKFFTVDVNEAPSRIIRITGQLGIEWKHFKGTQEDFVKRDIGIYGFIFLDADHNQDTVSRDMRILASRMPVGGMIAVDDTNEWTKIPNFEDVGLKRVYYEVDMGGKANHICYWKKA